MLGWIVCMIYFGRIQSSYKYKYRRSTYNCYTASYIMMHRLSTTKLHDYLQQYKVRDKYFFTVFRY